MSFACFILVPSIKTEPIDDYDPALICNAVHSGLGTVTQPYYSQHTMVTESPSCLVATMAPCQQLRSGLSSPDSRYHQQNPAAVIYQRSKSLSPSQLGYQQSNLMATPVAISDAHRSVLVHTGSPGQTSAVLHHSPGNQQSSPVIHYSPTNQQLRCGSHQEFQHIMCCENFTSNVARSSQPQVSQAQRLSPSSYPTVIQQQTASGQRAAKNGPPVSDQKEVLPAGVTIKQEQNLDQAYLDDGKHHSSLLWVSLLEGWRRFRTYKSHLFLGIKSTWPPLCGYLLFAYAAFWSFINCIFGRWQCTLATEQKNIVFCRNPLSCLVPWSELSGSKPLPFCFNLPKVSLENGESETKCTFFFLVIHIRATSTL